MSALYDWLDSRTGIRRFLQVMLLEEIPGGARWRYVWGSCLVFVFSIQLITGILLMTAYSPSDTAAWGSVHYIQYEMDFGWLIRGLHHFGSQTMMVLIALHMLQVVIAGPHLPPREINWWLGLMLLGITFGLSLTGYLLPWDQKGYWATRVATNIAGNTPGVGSELKQLIVGGDDYGNHTLTRFYALHVAILPLTLIVLILAHVAVFRRHGVTAPAGSVGQEMFWPGQAFRDLVVCLLAFGAMLSLVIYGHGSNISADIPAEMQPQNTYEDVARAGLKGWGANLDAPADRETPNYPARPEWYFLFLFQLLKYFPGDQVVIGTFVIPNGAMALLFFLPLLGYGAMRKFGHFVGILVIVSILGAVGVLTALALIDDSTKLLEMIGNQDEEKKHKAEKFEKDVEQAEKIAHRAAVAAMPGIPAEGSVWVTRHDPMTRGHDLFKMNCAVCHKYTPRDTDSFEGFTKGTFKASDLGDYASEDWVKGLLDNPGDPKYFGLTENGGMKKWRKTVERGRKKMDANQIKAQDEEFQLIARLLADQAKPKDKRDKKLGKTGMEAFANQDCNSCHKLDSEKDGETGPDLNDYGSAAWVRSMIMEPGSPHRHGKNNAMPAFRNKEGPGSEVLLREFIDVSKMPPTQVLHLADADRELIVRFVTRDYRVVFGGTPIAAPPKKE